MAHRSLHIINARLPGRDNLWQIQTHNGSIQAMTAMAAAIAPPTETTPAALETLDVEGDWISLGGIDLQINGALGLAFPDLTAEHHDKLAEIGKFLWSQGVDAYLPTLVTTSIDNIHRALAALAQFSACPPDPTTPTAHILGAHLEGPFLNAAKRGAHPQEHLQPLTLEQVHRVVGDGSHLKLITLAPELDPSGTVIPHLTSLGITVSLGHSQATAEQAQQAFQQGARMVTHAFNAMPGLHHREPGLLGAALVHPQVMCGLIADGQHICPTMLDLLLRIDRGDPATLPPNQGLFLVSDALAPLGLPDGMYPWDTRQIEVCAGTARLPDGTLAGTTLPLLAGAQNLVKWGLCEPGEAIALATIAPRRAMGLPGLEVGQPAHLLRWHLQNETRTLTWQRI